MNLDIQFKINNNYYMKKFIRENSSWYKILNREPERFVDFVEDMKTKYRLRTTDKINDFADKLEMVKNIINVLR
jgi:hypothetical protein